MILIISIFSSLFLSCKKAGVTESQASLEIIGAYNVTDENVGYVFFQLAENPEVLDHSQWFYSFDQNNGDIDPSKMTWNKLDLNSGVHSHRFIQCGDNLTCGSFTWKFDPFKQRISLRMLYNPEGTADLTTSATLRPMDAPSALVFGVFDNNNQKIRIQMDDNFGIPSRTEIFKYGMTRQFRVRNPGNTKISSDSMSSLRTSQGHNYLFPAEFCTSSNSANSTAVFKGNFKWLSETYDASDGTNGACFQIDFQDQNGSNLKSYNGYARRNPKFQSGHYKYSNPLTNAVKIPIIIAYCSNATGAGDARNEDFLAYQKAIIGYSNNSEDLCIKVGTESTFRTSLTSILSSKLAAAKAILSSTQDFVFVVVLHQNLSNEFRTFHQIISEELAAAASSESSLISPHLVGSFVYDSRSDFRPTSTQEKSMVWCPHNRPVDPSVPNTNTIDEPNCIVTDPVTLKIGFLNFVTPMGPFPTMSAYADYLAQYGDRGIAKKPDLRFSSVLKNGSTFTETSQKYSVTYFDSEHLVVGSTDRVRVCRGRENSSLITSVRLRSSTQSSTTAGIDLATAALQWDIGQGTGDYRIGVLWEIPFVGIVDYKSDASVRVSSFIPYSRSFSNYQLLGDLKWTASTLDFGNLLQVCKDFCSQPTFDENGTYQISTNFSDPGFLNCVSPKYPNDDDAP